MPTTVFAPYVAGHRNGDRAACLAGLALVSDTGRYVVARSSMQAPTDYAAALEGWRRTEQRIIIVEQDMAVHPLQIDELDQCLYPACVFAYYVGNTRDGQVRPELAHRKLVDGAEVPITEGDTFADRVSLGLAKIDPEAWRGVIRRPVIPNVSWRSLAWELSVALAVQWHVHWPAVAHHHWES